MDILNPRPFLNNCIDQPVKIQLKWNLFYQGTLKSFDAYFNIELADAVEFSTKKEIGPIGHVFIRCNNIQYILKQTTD